jgi:hypothetical protein
VMQHMNVQLLASTKPFITLSARMWKNIWMKLAVNK